MLRKQFILRLSLVVVALAAVALVGVFLLRGTLDELNQIDAQRTDITAVAQNLSRHIADLESSLLGQAHANALQKSLDQIDATMVSLQAFFSSRTVSEQSRSSSVRLASLASTLGADAESYLSPGDTDSRRAHDKNLRTLLDMRREATMIPLFANEFASAKRKDAIGHVHVIAVWLGIAVFVITASAGFLLYSTARMVLKPVGALLKVSRELSIDRFDARVPAGQPVEFAELASAYNLLASKMQQSEKRTLETLQQLALTLNHELNNAFAIVEMQLERLKRRNPDDPTLSTRLTEIRETLSRMTITVQSLTNLKRVVLTEYVPGQKMLDLAKSIADDDTTGSKEWTNPEVKTKTGTSQTSARSS